MPHIRASGMPKATRKLECGVAARFVGSRRKHNGTRMLEPAHPANERERLATLHSLQILDTPAEERFDRLTRLAKRLFDVPIAVVSLIDSDRQWFKSSVGLSRPEMPRVFDAEDQQLLRDLGRMAEQELASFQLAMTDDLTGLSNRRGFQVLAQRALNVCKRMGRRASLLFFDLKGFKQINDTHGHAEGDRALIGFAQVLRSALRDSDVIGRLGGDEFVALLTDCDDALCMHVAISSTCSIAKRSAAMTCVVTWGRRRMTPMAARRSTICWPSPTRRCTHISARRRKEWSAKKSARGMDEPAGVKVVRSMPANCKEAANNRQITGK
jgi:diguanylate cyclase (GGDEF)-like protein